MDKFKVGDRVKLIKIGGSVGTRWGYVQGDTAVVVDAEDTSSIELAMDNPKNDYNTIWVKRTEISPIITRKRKATYETIQINGKLYNLVPVEE